MTKAHFTLRLKPRRIRALPISPVGRAKEIYSLKRVPWSKKPYFVVGIKHSNFSIYDLQETKNFR